MTTFSKIEKAKTKIILNYPFFATLLLKKPILPFTAEEIERRPDRTETMAVYGDGTIKYNEEWVESLEVDEIVFVLAHEVMHLVLMTNARQQSRHPELWNVATDILINDILMKDGVGKMPRDADTGELIGTHAKVLDTETAEDVYARLKVVKIEIPSGGFVGCDAQGNKEDEEGGGEPISEAEMKVNVAEAAQAAKMQGKLQGKLKELVEGLLTVKTPWYEILERHMTSYVKQDYTWARPNKRYMEIEEEEFYLPSLAKLPTMGELAVVIDVSGSISEEELKYYNGHLNKIILSTNPTRVHVLYCDTSVLQHDQYEQGEEVKLMYQSGGGTDMEASLRYIEGKALEIAVAVVLTDGYTDFDAGFGSSLSFPTIWCISSEITAPYGVTIHFEKEK